MPRAIWKGHIAFGLVNIPVTLFSGEINTDLDFNMLDSRDKARIRYQRVNDVTGEEVPWDQIVKGYEFDEDQYVLLDKEDFENARPEASETVEVESFVKRDAIEDIYFDKPYILVPRAKGAKSYVLMRETLKSKGLVGIATVVIRTREYLSALLPKGDTLYLVLMRFAQELRNPDEFDIPKKSAKEYDITDKELKLANQLVEAMTEEWDPSAHEDEYRAALLEWINKRVEAGELERSPSAGEPAGEVESTEPIDISELLQRSVESVST
ncbi:MAG: Ku protein [Brevefilum sp.]